MNKSKDVKTLGDILKTREEEDRFLYELVTHPKYLSYIDKNTPEGPGITTEDIDAMVNASINKPEEDE